MHVKAPRPCRFLTCCALSHMSGMEVACSGTAPQESRLSDVEDDNAELKRQLAAAQQQLVGGGLQTLQCLLPPLRCPICLGPCLSAVPRLPCPRVAVQASHPLCLCKHWKLCTPLTPRPLRPQAPASTPHHFCPQTRGPLLPPGGPAQHPGGHSLRG
jgi:hypothetical protein